MDFQPLQVEVSENPSPAAPASEVSFQPLSTAALPASAESSAHDSGYQAGIEMAASQIHLLSQAFSQAESSRQEQQAAQSRRLETEAASLACQIAANLVDSELTLRPELVLSVVAGALGEVDEGSEVIVELSPEDLELLQQAPSFTADERISYRPDPKIQRGGCRVHSEAGDIDATRETRLAQMEARIQEISREQQ